MKLVVKLLIALLTATLQAQELKVAALFSDHMVLQRGQPVPVWGWSVPREEISVSFAGQRKTRKTDTNGKWLVSLDAMSASAEGRELPVESADNGGKISKPGAVPFGWDMVPDVNFFNRDGLPTVPFHAFTEIGNGYHRCVMSCNWVGPTSSASSTLSKSNGRKNTGPPQVTRGAAFARLLARGRWCRRG